MSTPIEESVGESKPAPTPGEFRSYEQERVRAKAPLVQQCDFVARPNRALHQDRRVHPCLAVMGSSDASHDFWVRLRSIGIKRDHFAAWVAVNHCNYCLRPNPQRLANELVFLKSSLRPNVDIHIRPKAPLVQIGSDLLAQLPGGLYRKERDRTAVGHGAIGPKQA